ncbi:MAG: hypothetical protein ACR2JY_18935 [Chloroflexota bacterium]
MATDVQVIEVARRLARGERLRISDAQLSAEQWKTIIATLVTLGFAEYVDDGQIWMISPEEQALRRRAAQAASGQKRRRSPHATGRRDHVHR